MRLDRLELTNFCQHRSRVVEFKDGATAITGPNGSGKSNLRAAVQYGLSGADPNYGRISDSVNWGTKRNEEASVVLTFTVAGHTYRVSRYLKSPQPMVPTLERVGTDDVVTGAEPVTARILELLNVTPALLTDYVIVGQGDIAAWFNKTPSARASEMAALMRLESVQRRYDAIGRFANQLEVPPVVDDTYWQGEHTSARARLCELQERAAADPAQYDVQALTEKRDIYANVIQQYLTQDKLRQACQRAQEDLRQRRHDLAAAEQDESVALAEVNMLESAVLQYDVVQLNRQQDAWVSYNAQEVIRDRAKQLAEKLHTVEIEQAALLTPQLDAAECVSAKSALKARLHEAQQELWTAQNEYSMLSTVQVGQTCPTCKQVVREECEHARRGRARLLFTTHGRIICLWH